MKKPTQCILWKKDTLTSDDLNGAFDVLETFEEDSHSSCRLVKCTECGQLYIKFFYEEVDWVNGNDPQYVTYVPVKTKKEINMAKTTGLSNATPTLHSDYPADAEKPKVYWMGRE